MLDAYGLVGELRSLLPWLSFVRFFFRKPSVGMKAEALCHGLEEFPACWKLLPGASSRLSL